ncbi:stage III sporulation protein AF [Paenibacillus sp. R14(2021)]|uniref:stage III sporulation protein AF n=1 Tax=Paenibacillus sp. R14(2021) TaxID=2859228 RepID=UPI001C6121F6|nr:stage III sporulation protein AF [Paenibacillus sp. R14(2021)]
MLTWLAVWLQQIIAVVLLAGFIDLLLPNKSMQRYVRLVAGLIILLTILTPIIRLLQGDFSARLDEEVEHWIQAESAKEYHMPSLQDIQDGAKALQKKQAASASELAAQKLAGDMKAGIEQRTGLRVASVSVRLVSDSSGQPSQLSGVIVTLAANKDEESAGQSQEGATAESVADVEAVTVTVEPVQAPASHKEAEARPVAGAAANAVLDVLKEGWSVNPAIVDIQEQAGDSAAAQ